MEACKKECVKNQELIDKNIKAKKIPFDSIKDNYEAECRLNPRTGYMEASFNLKRTARQIGSIFGTYCRYE